MTTLENFFSISFFGNSVQDYLNFLILFALLLLSMKIFKFFILARLKSLAKKTQTDFDDFLFDAVDHFGWNFFIVLSLYISSFIIKLPKLLADFLFVLFILTLTYYSAKILGKLVKYATKKISKIKTGEEIGEDEKDILDLIIKILEVFVWIFAILLLLSNFGINITALVAGLGIGGLAIAIALQSVLGDVFASFSIYFDKPFKKGDFITIGNDMGTVSKVGIKTTRIQTLQGEELVVSNKELTETRVHNFKKMEKRRIVFGFGVTYSTSTEKLKKIPEIVKSIISKTEKASIDRVHFKSFGDSSLLFEIVYYLDSNDYNQYMDAQQKINLAIKNEFEKEKIEMAFPTQTIHIASQKNIKKGQ